MFEFLSEHWQEFTIYTLYVSYVLTLLILISCYLIVLKTEKDKSLKFQKLYIAVPKERTVLWTSTFLPFSWWLPKIIRRKESPPDDSDPTGFLPNYIAEFKKLRRKKSEEKKINLNSHSYFSRFAAFRLCGG